MTVKTFSFKNFHLNFGGVPVTGFASGSSIELELDEDAFTLETGADGESTRVQSANGNAKLRVTLMQGSQSNDLFSAIHLADRKAGTGVVPCSGKELNGSTSFSTPEAYVTKLATLSRSKDMSENQWEIQLINPDVFIGGLSR